MGVLLHIVARQLLPHSWHPESAQTCRGWRHSMLPRSSTHVAGCEIGCACVFILFNAGGIWAGPGAHGRSTQPHPPVFRLEDRRDAT